MGGFKATRVDELRVEVVFPIAGGVSLSDLERFCQALRAQGALSQLPVTAERLDGPREQGYSVGPIRISAVLNSPRPAVSES